MELECPAHSDQWTNDTIEGPSLNDSKDGGNKLHSIRDRRSQLHYVP